MLCSEAAVCHEFFRALIATGVPKGLQLHQMDVTTAFLNGILKEEIYMWQEGFVVEALEHLKQFGFVHWTSDSCKVMGCSEMVVGIYVDDVVITGKSDKQVKVFKTAGLM